MTAGTPGFIGERLQEVREGCGLSQAALARLLGVSRQAISSYEKGAITPAPGMTKEISRVLGVTPSFFRRSNPLGGGLPETGATYFRSMAKAKKADRKHGQFRLDMATELISIALEYVGFPEVNIPDTPYFTSPEMINEQLIEHIAERLRSHWGQGGSPIQNVVWLLENNGFVVIRDDVATNDIDAFSAWRGDIPVMLLSSRKESSVRSRMDAAHELGHLVLHRYIDRIRLMDKDSHKLLEDQAKYFASAFLLPRAVYPKSIIVPSLEEFERVKPFWKVSIQGQIERSFNLRQIGASTRTRLWREVNARGWSKKEPLDEDIEVEMPLLLRKAFESAIEDGDVDSGTLEIQTGIPEANLRALLSLEVSSGESREPSNVVRFRP